MDVPHAAVDGCPGRILYEAILRAALRGHAEFNRPGTFSGTNQANEYDTLHVPIVTIDHSSDSETMATASNRQKATKGVSAKMTPTGMRPPKTPVPASVPSTPIAIASYNTTNPIRLPRIFAVVSSIGEIGRLITNARFCLLRKNRSCSFLDVSGQPLGRVA